MDLELTEEQRVWQRTVHDFVLKEIRPRAHEVDETGWPNTPKFSEEN